MPGLLDRVAAAARPARRESRSSVDAWLSEFLLPAMNQFSFSGVPYAFGSGMQIRDRAQEFSAELPGHSAALRSSPPAFAAQMVRAQVLSQARFTFRNRAASPTPGRKFGTQALSILERPWPNATTGELLSRMEWHAGLAGNAYVVRQRDRLRVLRPDWVSVLFGSRSDPENARFAVDGEIAGYVYKPGGFRPGNDSQMLTFAATDVAHWSPVPDPEDAAVGMSWVTPAMREIQGDSLASRHKIKFFENGATPSVIVKGLPSMTEQQFNEAVDMIERRHTGLRNAYRTLYLTAGADATVVGADLRQIDFKQVQGAGENRIAVLSRVPAVILGISEGLQGSSLNTGNFGQARRLFADTWVFPTLQDIAGALAPLLNVPADAELWFDTSDIPLLREDAKDAAEIVQIQAATIRQLVDGGFDPDTAVQAVAALDITQLRHTGLVSVQLQPPGTQFGSTQSGGQE